MISESERPTLGTAADWKAWRGLLGFRLPAAKPETFGSATWEVTWQDGFEPELPADFVCTARRSERPAASRPSTHKLILIGMSLGAAVQMLGYLGALLFW